MSGDNKSKKLRSFDARQRRDYDPSALPIAAPDRQISLAAVRDAASTVYRAAVRTPLMRVELSDLAAEFPRHGVAPPPEIYLKLESLQPIGSFKIRGAYNVVRQLGTEELQNGVWTVSAGNAAQGVAYAARLAGVRCS